MKNLGYYISEARVMFRLNRTSNLVSLLSIGLIFFVFGLVISGWQVSRQVVEAVQAEAEMNVYFDEALEETGVEVLLASLTGIRGIEAAALVPEAEAHARMEAILGQEATVLAYFDETPFRSFIEVKIRLSQLEEIVASVEQLPGVESVRDNREILDRVAQLARIFGFLGYLVVAAVGIATLVIISHMIRLGIYQNREQIRTLRLLGAPSSFIGAPFLMQGLLLTLGGGLLAGALVAAVIYYIYGQFVGPLPFIPLPARGSLATGVFTLILALSGALGLVGSLIGLSRAQEK